MNVFGTNCYYLMIVLVSLFSRFIYWQQCQPRMSLLSKTNDNEPIIIKPHTDLKKVLERRFILVGVGRPQVLNSKKRRAKSYPIGLPITHR